MINSLNQIYFMYLYLKNKPYQVLANWVMLFLKTIPMYMYICEQQNPYGDIPAISVCVDGTAWWPPLWRSCRPASVWAVGDWIGALGSVTCNVLALFQWLQKKLFIIQLMRSTLPVFEKSRNSIYIFVLDLSV